MKKLLSTAVLICLGILPAFAQKYAYVETEYILSNVPEYKAAQSQIDNMSVQWQKEIEARYAEIDKMYRAFQAESILLTDEMKKKRENEIIAKEKDAKDLQKQRFGVDGDLFKKRQELVKPIQDKIYNAIKALAEKGNYAVIFDKSSDLSMLYSNPKYDKSDDILVAMGYKKGTRGTSGGSQGGGSQQGGASPANTKPTGGTAPQPDKK
jgi:outer membrane protein